MVLILPPELTSGDKRWVCCQATVTRVENNPDGTERGVAARMRNMQVFLRSSAERLFCTFFGAANGCSRFLPDGYPRELCIFLYRCLEFGAIILAVTNLFTDKHTI